MKSELLARSPLLALPLVVLVAFFAVFVAVLFVTLRRKGKAYEPVARLALEGDADEGGAS